MGCPLKGWRRSNTDQDGVDGSRDALNWSAGGISNSARRANSDEGTILEMYFPG